MSKNQIDAPQTDDDHQAAADIFGQSLDPLEEFETKWKMFEQQRNTNPFEMFMVDRKGDKRDKTKKLYWEAYNQWFDFMTEEQNRHPACPSQRHVREWAQWLATERGNALTTIENKIRKVGKVFEYIREEDSFPTEQYEKHTPVVSARKKIDFETDEEKPEPPHIPLKDHRALLEEVDHIQELAVIATMMKLGLRAGELCNIKLEDFHINGSALGDEYPELGSNSGLDGNENAVYIPPKSERDGNKSKNSRILPLDEELRYLWRRYLLIRPSNPDGWMFLSKPGHKQLDPWTVNESIWKKHYRPQYGFPEDPKTDDVTSHYGRHFFTTFWKTQADEPMPREWVQYMRGDVIDTSEDSAGGEAPNSIGSDAVDVYVHVDYEDIEQPYRDGVYKLNL